MEPFNLRVNFREFKPTCIAGAPASAWRAAASSGAPRHAEHHAGSSLKALRRRAAAAAAEACAARAREDVFRAAAEAADLSLDEVGA